jgi:3',5'-cyclic AMP phosphodiesterase CpdA
MMKNIMSAILMILMPFLLGCNQKEGQTSLEIFEEQLSLGFEAVTAQVTVKCNQTFLAESSDRSWCVTSVNNDVNEDNLVITVAKNTGEERNATIKVSSGNLEKNILVVQAGAEKVEEELPRFAVISDTHLGNNVGEGPLVKVPQALKNLMSKTPLVDALFDVGDITDNGKAQQYDDVIRVFAENVPKSVTTYFLMGNHDNISGPDASSIYRDKLKQPLNQYIILKGYPFITVSQTGTGPRDFNVEAQNFLKTSLADATIKFPGKPVFVFVHVPPLNTVYGSSTAEGWGTDVFLSILEQYPQAIVFSGHSHYPVGDPRSIHQNKFTSINTGSTTYSEVESGVVNEGIHPGQFDYVTEGLIVTVLKDNSVQFERWDTYRNEEILPRWVVKAPHDGSQFTYKNRNGQPAPTFAKDAKPVCDIINDGYVVSFPQASDNEAVHRYRVELLDGNTVEASTSTFSMFYLNSRTPKELSVAFSGIPAGKTLVAQVKAIDSYNNESEPIVGNPFQSIHFPDPDQVGVWLFDNPDNPAHATLGKDLIAHGTGFAPVDGPDNADKAVCIKKGSFYEVLHGIAPNGGGTKVNNYTIMIDFRIPEANKWYTFMQANPNNTDDGDLFVNLNGQIGIGIVGYSSTTIRPGEWYRMVLSVKSGYWHRCYLNGALILDGAAQSVDGRFALSPSLLLFADENGEDNDIDIAEVAIWNGAIDEDYVKRLNEKK